jgi:hypothetical protein
MRFLTEAESEIPQRLLKSAELALNTALQTCLEGEDVEVERAVQILADAKATGVPLDEAGLSLAITRAVDRLAAQWSAAPENVELMQRFEAAVTLATSGRFQPNLWRAQNAFWQVAQSGFSPAGEDGRETLARLAAALNIALPPP